MYGLPLQIHWLRRSSDKLRIVCLIRCWGPDRGFKQPTGSNATCRTDDLSSVVYYFHCPSPAVPELALLYLRSSVALCVHYTCMVVKILQQIEIHILLIPVHQKPIDCFGKALLCIHRQLREDGTDDELLLLCCLPATLQVCAWINLTGSDSVSPEAGLTGCGKTLRSS